jgi:hypothetical protein
MKESSIGKVYQLLASHKTHDFFSILIINFIGLRMHINVLSVNVMRLQTIKPL